MLKIWVNNVLPKLGETAMLMALTPVIRPVRQIRVHHSLGEVYVLSRLLEADHQYVMDERPYAFQLILRIWVSADDDWFFYISSAGSKASATACSTVMARPSAEN